MKITTKLKILIKTTAKRMKRSRDVIINRKINIREKTRLNNKTLKNNNNDHLLIKTNKSRKVISNPNNNNNNEATEYLEILKILKIALPQSLIMIKMNNNKTTIKSTDNNITNNPVIAIIKENPSNSIMQTRITMNHTSNSKNKSNRSATITLRKTPTILKIRPLNPPNNKRIPSNGLKRKKMKMDF